MAETSRWPLSWPTGWRRTPSAQRQTARFESVKVEYGPRNPDGTLGYRQQQRRQLSIADALMRLTGELRRLGVGDSWLLSTNVRTRLDGLPYSNAAEPMDPGAAVYFRLKGKPRVLACDKWRRVADNIAAVAAHIEAIRAIERYGVGSLEQAFAGYAALPANTAANWRDVFGFAEGAMVTMAEVNEKFRTLAKDVHPDRPEGSDQAMARLSEARNFAREELQP